MSHKDSVKVPKQHSLEAGLGQAIRATLICTSEGSIPVTPQVQDTLKVTETPESKMAKMKKKISSPLVKRKSNVPAPSNPNKVFGVHLEEVLGKDPGNQRVPHVVTKIVEYITKNGMHLEGIFRVSGNRRVVENLKTAFDKDGDANLEESGDVMAVAELLKLYLRELPDPCIPQLLTPEFIKIHKAYGEDNSCREELKLLLEKLPDAHYYLTKYLCKFLVSVSKKEDNKMSSRALAIVFGPNLFRCSDGLEGLKEQGHTNAIVCKFLQEYDYLFKDDEGVSPYASTALFIEEAGKNSSFSLSEEGRQVQHKVIQDNSTSEEDASLQVVAGASVENQHKPSLETIYAAVKKPKPKPKPKPRLLLPVTVSSCSSTEELDTYVRSVSPSPIVHGNSHSSAVHGLASHGGKDVVQHAIKLSVKEHLFGPEHVSTDETSQDSGLSRVHSPESGDDEAAPALPERRYGPEESQSTPRKRRRKKNSKSQLIVDEKGANIIEDKNRITHEQLLRAHKDENVDVPSTLQCPTKRRPKSKANELFENERIIIGVDKNSNDIVSKSIQDKKENQQEMQDIELIPQDEIFRNKHQEDDFACIQRHSEPLKPLTLDRAPPPKNRRRPSFNKPITALDAFELMETPETQGKNDPQKYQQTKHGKSATSFVHPLVEEAKTRDVISSPPPRSPRSPKIKQSPPLSPVKKETHTNIDEVDSGFRPKASREVQKQKKRHRGVVPPLELYKLNEDGVSLDVQVSPRDRYEGYMYPTECPPSPPHEQLDHGWFERRELLSILKDANTATSTRTAENKKHNSCRMDASPKGEVSVKQLAKTISQLKKKIREFEDTFEDEHGRKPSHSEKAPVKKHITDLNHARKQLKELKEKAKDEAERLNETVPALGKTTVQASIESLLTTTPGSVQHSLDIILRKLEEKRSAAGRPVDVEQMSREQIQEEKLAIQKSLLQHENVFGRPTSKRDKDVMRPLYDRYRMIKRAVAKPRPDKENPVRSTGGTKLDRKSRSTEKLADLEPIHEDSLLQWSGSQDNQQRQRATTEPANTLFKDPPATSSLTTPLYVNTKTEFDDHPHLGDTGNFDDTFSVTRMTKDFEGKSGNVKLHEMPEGDLRDELESATKEKKKLRKKLKKFEDDFVDRTGRKVQREDRGDMEDEYSRYKQIKARLRLLEALLTKRQASQTL